MYVSHDCHMTYMHICVCVCVCMYLKHELELYVCAATSSIHQFGVVWEEVIVFGVIRQQ